MMMTVLATPAGPKTTLRIICECEMGTYGRYRLTAFDGDMWVYSQYYDWATWLGSSGGRMFMPDFVATSEKEANARRKPTSSSGGVNVHFTALQNDISGEVAK